MSPQDACPLILSPLNSIFPHSISPLSFNYVYTISYIRQNCQEKKCQALIPLSALTRFFANIQSGYQHFLTPVAPPSATFPPPKKIPSRARLTNTRAGQLYIISAAAAVIFFIFFVDFAFFIAIIYIDKKKKSFYYNKNKNKRFKRWHVFLKKIRFIIARI